MESTSLFMPQHHGSRIPNHGATGAYAAGVTRVRNTLEPMVRRSVLFVMRPHPQDPHYLLVFVDGIDKSMLDVDPSRVCALKVAHKLFVEGWSLVRIRAQDAEEGFGFWPKTTLRESPRVLLCLLREDELVVAHQPGSGAHSFRGVFMPLRMESFMPGMETRYNVS